MKLKQISSVIAGLVLTLLVYFIVTTYIVFGSFNLSGETLKDHEKMDGLIFYTYVILGIATLYTALKFWKNGKKYTSIGTGLPILFALFCISYFGGIYLDNFNYYESFDKTEWNQEKLKPLNMSITLNKDGKLIGLNKEQIINQLGNGKEGMNDIETKKNSLIYLTGPSSNRWQEGNNEGFWEFRIFFHKDKVVSTDLFQGGFDF